jgi:hypothetical protein
MKEDDNLK